MARRRASHEGDGTDEFRDAGAGEDAEASHGEDGPSRSELKRRDLQLRELGVALVALPVSEFEALELPDKLADAVKACRTITAHGARLRQEMYIAKVLRHVDVEPIRAALDRRSENDRQRVRREHALEQWRERLLADEPDAWTELAVSLDDPAALQPLRTLARQARAERASSRPPAASRQLFRRLRELLADRDL